MSRFVPNSKYVKYRDGTWIEWRKRIYLYWCKFLRHAEQSSDHKVQWNKYRAWSGKNAVMNMKFDDWWEDHWKDCFGIDEETGRFMDMVNTQFPSLQNPLFEYLSSEGKEESFYEANFRIDEEFDNAEIAAKSNNPSDNAKVTVLDLKFDKSRIKLTKDEESKDGFK